MEAAEASKSQGARSGDLWPLDWALFPGLGQPSLPPLYLLGHVRFIDYEYTGYNYQAFDIGNHFNEFAGEGRSCWTHTQGSIVMMGTRSTRRVTTR